MRCRPSLVRGRAAQVNPGGFTTPARRPSVPHRTAGCGKSSLRPLMADSVEKVGLAAACRSGVPAVEVAASHFRLPFDVSLSVLAQA
ncbi:TPA: hypothetical protein L6A23_31110 [Pseudomonas aeruginosa]|nr:hypothetical protein [Pseudomonas aeruginosa]HBP5996628.1 hypothetical protein [Pseudomonas aeruginosa]